MFDVVWSQVPFISGQWHNMTYSIPSVDNLDSPISMLTLFEIIFFAPSIVLFGYLLFVSNLISLFHPNIFALFNYASIWVFLGYLGRGYVILIRLNVVEIDPFLMMISSFLRLQYFGQIITIQGAFTLERIFATYFVSDYEKNHRTWILCIVLPLTTLSAQLFSLPLFFSKPLLIFPLGYCIFMTVFSFFMINYLYFSNSKKLLAIKQNPILYSLSKKYQIEENLRVMWYLRGMLFIFIVACGLMTIFFLLPPFFGLPEVDVKSIIRCIDVGVVLLCTMLPTMLFVALYHVKNAAFLRMHKCIFGRKNLLTISSRIQPIMVNEANEYFERLNKSWK